MQEPLDPSKSLVFLTNRVGRQLAVLLLRDLEFEGWKPQGTHLGLMADLACQDGLRQQDLAINAIKDKGTVARGLDGLEAEGLVSRQTDPSDRRSKLVFMTDKGRHFQHSLPPLLAATHTEAVANVPAEDLATCIRVLRTIHQNLQHNLSSTATPTE